MRGATSFAIAAVLVLAGGCGGTSERPALTAPARTLTARFEPHRTTAAERRAIARRLARERPRYSSIATRRRVAALPAARQRAALVAALRRSVLRDARRRARRHELDGPFRGASCRILREDRDYAAATPEAPVLRYDCLAYTARANTDPPVALGSPFVARVDFARHYYAWCLFTPVGGEGAHTAKTFDVKPDPACIER